MMSWWRSRGEFYYELYTEANYIIMDMIGIAKVREVDDDVIVETNRRTAQTRRKTGFEN